MRLSKKFKQKYYQNIITIYFAPPRTGKTTYASKIAYKCQKKNIPVYSNFACKGCNVVDTSDFGTHQLEDCKVVFDEAGISMNSRNWSKFPQEAIQFFKLHGHYRCSIDIFSQSYDDMDKVVRTLAQQLYLMKRSLIPFTVKAVPIYKKIGINELTKEICDEYYTLPWYIAWTKTKWCFMPKYWKMFDSWDAPKLKPMDKGKWTNEPVKLTLKERLFSLKNKVLFALANVILKVKVKRLKKSLTDSSECDTFEIQNKER